MHGNINLENFVILQNLVILSSYIVIKIYFNFYFFLIFEKHLEILSCMYKNSAKFKLAKTFAVFSVAEKKNKPLIRKKRKSNRKQKRKKILVNRSVGSRSFFKPD